MNSNINSTFRKKVMAQGKNIREQNITQANQTFLNTFKQSGSYYSVGIGNINNKFDVQIFNLESFNKIDSIKNMQLAPYQDITEFHAGNYVYWTDDANIPSIWIIKSTDRRSPQKPMSEIYKCNTNLQWIDSDGIKRSVKCVFRDKFSAQTPRISSDVKTYEGNTMIFVPLNELTSKITANQTFIFGGIDSEIASERIAGQKYKIMALQYESNDYEIGERLLTIVIEKTNPNPETDDLYGNWTDLNSEKKSITPPETPGGFYIYEVLPNVTSIKKGVEVVFTIKELLDGEDTGIKFNVVDDKWVNWNKYYNIDGIDGDLSNCNSFKIKNTDQYNNGNLKINIYKNINELVKILEVRLGGII